MSDVRITVGSDPEFNFFREGNFVPATRVIEDEYGDAEIGLDGHNSTGELRPEYGESAVAHFNHLRDVISRLAEIANDNNLDVDTIGNHEPLGFHIHFGLPNFDPYAYESNHAVQVMVKALDHYLGRGLLGLSGAARGHYGQLGQYEFKRYGFEYRPLPAIIMQEPDVLQIILELAEKVVRWSYGKTMTDVLETRRSVAPSHMIFTFLGRRKYHRLAQFKRKYRGKSARQESQATMLRCWGLHDEERRKTAVSGQHTGSCSERDVLFSHNDMWNNAVCDYIRNRVLDLYHRIPDLPTVRFYGLALSREAENHTPLVYTSNIGPLFQTYLQHTVNHGNVPLRVSCSRNRSDIINIGLSYTLRTGNMMRDALVVDHLVADIGKAWNEGRRPGCQD